MAFAIHSRGARSRTAAAEPRPAAMDTAAPRIYERPVGTALTGLIALIVGAWGAIAGYIGPYFDYRPVAHDVWVSNLPDGLLHLAPGAVAAAAGLMLMVMGPARRSVRGGAFLLPAVLLLAAGSWFVIGPVAWPTFEHSAAFMTGVSANHQLLNVAGSSYAPGLVLVMLGGIAWKAIHVPPVAVEDPYMPAEAGPAGTAPVERGGRFGSRRRVTPAPTDVTDGTGTADRTTADRTAAVPATGERPTEGEGRTEA